MAETFTGEIERLLVEIRGIRANLERCLKFIRTIPEDARRLAGDSDRNGWTKELRAIKREVKA
ncbi:MAG: hypothetical protein WC481_07675 [Candidatus Omnitrophota bacterium]